MGHKKGVIWAFREDGTPAFLSGTMGLLGAAQAKLILACRNKWKGAGLIVDYGWAGEKLYARHGNFPRDFAELAI
jgi:hypothetical protein